MNPRIFIVDTNVIAAGLITGRSDSPTAQVLDAMLAGRLIYLLSPNTTMFCYGPGLLGFTDSWNRMLNRL